jgi:hypothetical protein
MKERRKATTENNKGLSQFCKNCLNTSYRKDIMNSANYNRLSILSKNKVFLAQCHPDFVGCRKITNNGYLVEKHTRIYRVKTTIYETVFTLDNTKFRYLKFVYDFLYKCLDMTKVHFVEEDTDSMYMTVAGNLNDDCHE